MPWGLQSIQVALIIWPGNGWIQNGTYTIKVYINKKITSVYEIWPWDYIKICTKFLTKYIPLLRDVFIWNVPVAVALRFLSGDCTIPFILLFPVS